MNRPLRWTLTNSVSGTFVLTTDPRRFDEIEILLKRSEKYHGIFHEFSVSVGFVCKGGGKEFIDNIYETQGVNAIIDILIEFACGGGAYDVLFTGRLDLSKYSRDKLETSVTIDNRNFSKVLRTKGDVKIDLSSLVSLGGSALTAYTFAPYDLVLHSQTIFFRNLFSYDSNVSRSVTFTLDRDDPYYLLFQHDYELFYSDLGTALEITPSINNNIKLPLTFGDTAGEPFYQNTSGDSIVIDIYYEFDGSITDRDTDLRNRISNGMQFNIWMGADKATATPTTLTTTPSYNTSALERVDNFTFSGTLNVTVPPGLFLWYGWEIIVIGSNGYLINGGNPATADVLFEFDYTTAILRMTNESTTPATECKAFVIHEAFSRICESICDQPAGAFKSEFFGRKDSQPITYASNGCGSFTAITNGFQIRQFPFTARPGTDPTSIKKIFSSINELFDSMNAIWNLGLGIEWDGTKNVFRVEKKEFFYNDTVIMQCQNITDLVVSFAPGYAYSEANIGYQKWENEQVNGLDEFNARHEYVLPVESIQNKFDQLAGYVASGYAIEFTRRKSFFNFPTEDTGYDEDNFVIALNRSVNGSGVPNNLDEAEKDENFSSVTGILSPETTYNLRLSPKRNFIRWLNILAPTLIRQAGELIKFVFGEANSSMVSDMVADGCTGDYSGQPLAENADIAQDDADAANPPLWVPEFATFSYPLSYAEFKQVLNNSNGVIEYSEGTTDFKKGYILDAAYLLGKKARFKLLRKYD